MIEENETPLTTLATGEQVSLEAASRWLSLLRSHLQSPDTEWDVVYWLRQLCLGEPVDASQLETLRAEGFLDDTDELDPVLRAVVHAAVRGQERALYLDSPFITSHDRTVAAVIDGLNTLEPQEAKRLFEQSADRSLQHYRDRMDDTVPNNQLTAEEIQDAYRRLFSERQGPDSSPPPPSPQR